MRRPGTLAALLVGLTLLLVPHTAPTQAVFTDSAEVTTGSVGAGVFVPAAARPVRCATFGPVLTPAINIRFTTDTVAAPARGSVEYVLRIVRVDVAPEVVVTQVLMDVSGTTATTAFTTGGLTLLGNARYQARVTTRLLGQERESNPAQASAFTIGGVLLNAFTCVS